MESAGNKKNDTRRKKFKHYLYQVFVPFIAQEFPYSSFLCFPQYIENTFLEIIQSHRGFIYYGKLFLNFGNLTLISVNTRTFVKTNSKRMK